MRSHGKRALALQRRDELLQATLDELECAIDFRGDAPVVVGRTPIGLSDAPVYADRVVQGRAALLRFRAQLRRDRDLDLAQSVLESLRPELLEAAARVGISVDQATWCAVLAQKDNAVDVPRLRERAATRARTGKRTRHPDIENEDHRAVYGWMCELASENEDMHHADIIAAAVKHFEGDEPRLKRLPANVRQYEYHMPKYEEWLKSQVSQVSQVSHRGFSE